MALNVLLREVRIAARLSQADLAAKAGISRQTLNAIESRKHTPGADVALRIAGALDCRVEDILRLADATPVPTVSGHFVPGGRLVAASLHGEPILHPLAPPEGFTPADAIAGDQRTARLLIPPEQLDGTILIAGCDPSLSVLAGHAARRSTAHRVVWVHANSGEALALLKNRRVHVAGTHFPQPSGRQPNVSEARRAVAGRGGSVFNYATWEQGLVLAPGNPHGIHSVADLARPHLQIVNREPGSGSRRLLDALLAEAGAPADQVRGYERSVGSHMAVGRAVLYGAADAGTAIGAVAHAFGLDFLPLAELRFDLVIPNEHIGHPAVRFMRDILDSPAFRADLRSLPGYDLSRTGSTLHEIPSAA